MVITRSGYRTPARRPAQRNTRPRRGAGRRVLEQAVRMGVRQVPGGSLALTAYDAARTIQRAYRKRQNSRRKSGKMTALNAGAPRRFGKAWHGVSTGKYAGKFAKPVRGLPREAQAMVPYQNQGFVACEEVYGKVDDLDCVYVGHTTYQPTNLAFVIAMATLRKAFKKAGFNVDSPDQELMLYDYINADGFKLEWLRVRADGTVVANTYITVDNDTLRTVTNNSGFFTEIRDAMAVEAGSTRGAFQVMNIYSSDRNGVSTNWRLAASLNLLREVVDIKVLSTLTVQNRTKSASGASSTDVVDNQPLHGYLYHFAGGVPQCKQIDLQLNKLCRVRYGSAIILEQSVDLVPAQLFKEPPNPKIFNNCHKSAAVKLEPGDMKKTYLESTWRGYFNNIVLGKLLNRTGNGYMQFAPGKVQLLALEERLNSGSTNPVTVNYECDRKTGVMLITTKNPTALAEYSSQEINNVTV